jgi:hypothetical protein
MASATKNVRRQQNGLPNGVSTVRSSGIDTDVPELWQLNNYDDFVEARKALIKEKFKYMLHDGEGRPA